MAPESAPGRAVLENQARRLLELARAQSGESVDRMVKSLGEFQPRGAGTRRSWYDWQERPETISLLTGLAVMHALGPDATLELVFGSAYARGSEASDELSERVDRLHAAIADALAEVTRLRERVEGFVVPELERQGELLARVVAGVEGAGILDTAAPEQPVKRRKGAAGG
jgi:hypothetical protein